MTAPADADDRIAAYEARQDAPEALRERVAEALWAQDTYSARHGGTWSTQSEIIKHHHRRAADAAIATICTPVPGVAKGDGADEAVRRVLALADELEVTASRYRHAAPGSHDAGARSAHEITADRIRAAVKGW